MRDLAGMLQIGLRVDLMLQICQYLPNPFTAGMFLKPFTCYITKAEIFIYINP